MCEPISLTTLAIASAATSAAGTAVAYKAQADAASDQANYQNRRYSQTSRLAYDNYIRMNSQALARQGEERQLTSESIVDNAAAAQAAQGTVAAAAGDRGYTGNNLASLFMDFDRQEARNNLNLQTNYGWKVRQTGEEMAGYRADALNRIAGVTPGPVAQPSLLAAALSIGTTALTAYDTTAYRTQTGPYQNGQTSVPRRTV